MKLELRRHFFTDKSTIGKLSIGGVFECFTLEDVVREPFEKIPGQTAIRAGSYQIIVNMSERFKRMMPLLINVPDFAGVRIHSGNTAADTEGCILVGLYKGENSVGASRVAFDSLFEKIDREFGRGQKIEIEIINDRAADQPARSAEAKA